MWASSRGGVQRFRPICAGLRQGIDTGGANGVSFRRSALRLEPELPPRRPFPAAVKPRLIAVASSPNSPKTCAVVFSGRHGSATERLSDGATGPTGLCGLRAHHTRLIKTGDYQARSFTALEAAM